MRNTLKNIISCVMIFVMERKQKNNFFKRNLDIFILIMTTAVGSLLALFNIGQKLDYRFYDTMLAWSEEPKADSSILLVDIDDISLNELGTWPWKRDILADVLIRMKELGAQNMVFDIEYLSPSSVSVSDNINSLVMEEFSSGEESISQAVTDFGQAVEDGSISRGESVSAAQDLVYGTIDPVLSDMLTSISDNLNIDTDDYLARAIQFFGNASLTINMRDVKIEVSPEDHDYSAQRFLFDNVNDPSGLVDAGNIFSAGEEGDGVERGFSPAIRKIISSAAGAGFTNVVVDHDGTRRRVELLNYDKESGRYTGQLAFAPLIRLMDVTALERKRNSLILKGARLPGLIDRQDIKIPLDGHGRMMINWLHALYGESFKHVGVYTFKYLDWGEEEIYSALKELAQWSRSGAFSVLPPDEQEFIANAEILAAEYQDILETKKDLLSRCQGFDENGIAIGGGLSQEDYDRYFEARNEFFAGVQGYAESLMKIDGFSDMELPSTLAQAVDIYLKNLSDMKSYLSGTFCIVGNSSTGSTDLGVTPFQRRYANLGTHANVVNTILQRDFIRCESVWWGIALAFFSALLVILLTKKKGPASKSVFGLIYLAVTTGTLVCLMVFWQVYIPAIVPIVIAAVTFLAELAMSFILTERDKNTLRRGFDAYVAPEVVSEIVKNPDLLGLGGVNKHISALFSDVRTFSGFTECVNREEGEQHGAVRLVDILNGYLGALSDAIMKEHGTIDKYVGDEIVSFFGAPIDNPNHAFDACVAGIRMKQAEDIYNAEHEKELPIHPVTKTPFLLKSRVGVNTGDMVVGNMGTEKKLNYTIMGNNVNLASRLEGTNKVYDSWIMVSESTWREADSGKNQGLLVAKKLDCVRVVNVDEPVQIFSIQGLRSELPSEQVEASELFNKAMEWYMRNRGENGLNKDLHDFQKAKEYFEEAYRCYHVFDSQDKNYISTEKKMIERCDNFLTNGLPRDKNGVTLPWDGVYTMTSK